MRETKSIKQQTCNPLGISLRGDSPDGSRAGTRRPACALERWLLGQMLKILGVDSVAMVTWDGKVVALPGGENAEIKVRLGDVACRKRQRPGRSLVQ